MVIVSPSSDIWKIYIDRTVISDLFITKMAHQFIKNRDIVLFSSQPWNSGIAFNFKDMAFELARYNRVLFIDRAGDRHSMLKRIFSSKKREAEIHATPERIQENFWILHPKSMLESGNWSPTYK